MWCLLCAHFGFVLKVAATAASQIKMKLINVRTEINFREGVESDPHQKMIHMGKSEIDRHIRKVIHIPIGKVITIYYLVKS